MYILHAHWQPPTTPTATGTLIFWAETALAPQPPRYDRNREQVLDHPFAVDAKTLRQILLPLTGATVKPESGTVTLLLPTTLAGPQPSPSLLHDWKLDRRSKVTLERWRMEGLHLAPSAALPILTHLPAAFELPANIRIGDDLRFWETATMLVLEVLAQQKVLPTLAQADADGQNYHARWMPVVDGPRDAPRLARLLEAMPPLCRSGADSIEAASDPQQLLDSFLNTMTDALARQWGLNEQPAESKSQNAALGWLRGLFGANPAVKAANAQLQRLQNSYYAWLRNLYVAGDRHVRVAFRLEAPLQQVANDKQGQEKGESWMLHFLLQAREDPSLLIPATEIWQTSGTVLKALGRQVEQPQEKLLSGLGYAARHFPPLAHTLQASTPTSAALSTADAYTFLRETAPLLEESGFGILVPPWWNKPGRRLGVRLQMQGKQKSGADAIASNDMTMDKLVSYRWELALGDTTLSKAEFDALVALKSPLVQIRGQWVQLDPQQIEAAIAFFQRHAEEKEVGLHEAIGLGLGTTELDGLPVEDVAFEGWLAEWMQRFTGNEQLAVLPPPAALNATLRPYQAYGYSWIDFLRRWGMGACLADDMGLGKTIQTLAMLLRIKEQETTLPGPVLLVAPTSVVTNWAKEVARFAPALFAHVHQGGDRLKGQALVDQFKAVDLVLTSYPLIRRDAEWLQQVNWFGLILDEAQNIKNPQAQQTRSLRELSAGFRLALTGTPVENRLSELWSIMHFLNPDYLGSQQHFRQRFALPIERYQDKESAEQLRKLVSPFILRRVKTDPTVIQDLPEKTETKVYTPLTAEQATLYEAVVREALDQINNAEDEMARRGKVLSMLMQLKQICNHPAQYLHQIGDDYTAGTEEKRSGKLSRLVEMLEEITTVGDRVLIFTQFAEMGQLLRSYLQQQLGVSTLFLHGGTPAKARQGMVEQFQEQTDGPPIFILSLKAGGVGLNLTRASHVFHFDRWWNPAVENQATDRAFRIGQKRNVQVHKFVCTGTLEERIDEMIERKQALAQSIIGDGEGWLTELSTSELREMVTLRREEMA